MQKYKKRRFLHRSFDIFKEKGETDVKIPSCETGANSVKKAGWDYWFARIGGRLFKVKAKRDQNMTAKDILQPGKTAAGFGPRRTVDAEMPLIEVLPRLLESPVRELGVKEGETWLGVVDSDSLLEGLGRMIAARDDCSVITVECRPEDYSASQLAHAVEDSDAHLVDLLSTPSDDGRLRVTLRVRHCDPSAAVHSLERYDYKVVEAYGGNSEIRDAEVAMERILSLQTMLNV